MQRKILRGARLISCVDCSGDNLVSMIHSRSQRGRRDIPLSSDMRYLLRGDIRVDYLGGLLDYDVRRVDNS